MAVASDSSLGATSNTVYVLSGASLVFTGNAPTTGRTFNLANGTLAPSGGTLTYAGATVNGGLNADGTAGMAGGFDPTKSYSFVLVQADSGITGYNPAGFVVDTSSFQNSTQGGSFSVVQQGNNLNLVFNAVTGAFDLGTAGRGRGGTWLRDLAPPRCLSPDWKQESHCSYHPSRPKLPHGASTSFLTRGNCPRQQRGVDGAGTRRFVAVNRVPDAARC